MSISAVAVLRHYRQTLLEAAEKLEEQGKRYASDGYPRTAGWHYQLAKELRVSAGQVDDEYKCEGECYQREGDLHCEQCTGEVGDDE